MAVPQYAEQGIWELSFLTVADNVGNRKRVYKDDMIALGFPTEFRNCHRGDLSSLTVTKTANPSVAHVGDTITYTYAVNNTGGTTIHSITLTDSKIPGTIPLSKDTLVPGESATGSATYTVAEEDLPGPLENIAAVTGIDSQGKTVTGYGGFSVTLTYNPDLAVTKTAAPTTARVGNVVTYTYIVKNTGDVTIYGISLSDDKIGQIILNKTKLASGQAASGTSIYTVLEGDLPGPLVNTATASGTDILGETVTRYGGASVTLTYTSELTVTKIVDPAVAQIDDIINYTYLVENTGDITIGGINLVDDKLGQILLNKTTLASGDLAKGSTTYTVKSVDLPGPIVNAADVSGIDSQGDYVTNVTSASVTLVSLDLNKTASQNKVSPGKTVTYTINYANSGGLDLSNVVLTETYPKGTQFISASPAPDPDTNNKWSIGDLPIGASGTITVTLKVTESTNFVFTKVGSTNGTGFVRVSDRLSTTREPYSLRNVVTITSTETGPIRSAASVTVCDPGTELSTREHGSGLYDTKEQVRMRTENKSISMEKAVSATYAPTPPWDYTGTEP